ncbi:hypothetical protein D3C73_1391010 [compost metagenome]
MRQHVETVVLTEAQIKKTQVEHLTLQQHISLGRAVGGGNAIALVFEAVPERSQDGGFVIHQQNAALMLGG